MRLDLFLKASRICPRRTVAQNLCDSGLVLLNGTRAKPAHPVKPGDELIIRRRDKISTFRILATAGPGQTTRQQASELYELINEETIPDLL